MTTTKQEQYKMSDSDFGFDGGDSDLDFGFDVGDSASLSDDEEVVDTSFGNEDILVTAEIDDSSGDEVVATAEVIMKKCRHHRYTIQEKLMILCQVCHQMNNREFQQSVCNSININRKLIIDWNKQFPQLRCNEQQSQKSM